MESDSEYSFQFLLACQAFTVCPTRRQSKPAEFTAQDRLLPQMHFHAPNCCSECLCSHIHAADCCAATDKQAQPGLSALSALANHCCKQARMTRKCMNNITSAYIPDESKPSSRFPLLLRTWQKAEFWLKDQAKSE